MTARIKITRCEALETLESIGPCPEEGYPRYIKIWEIVADTEDGRTLVWPDHFKDHEMATRLAGEIGSYGTVNPEKWDDVTPHPGNLPDYVFCPWGPEYR